MSTPFLTPDKLLASKKKYHLKNDSPSGDGFFINDEYKGNLSPPVAGKKLRHAFLALSLIVFLLLARVSYLQIIKGQEFHSLAEGNRIRAEILPSPRGLIYDRQGKALVNNLAQFSLLLDKSLLDQEKVSQDDLVTKISFLTGLETGEIRTSLDQFNKDKAGTDLLIAFDLPYQKAMLFKANEADYPGLRLQITSQRNYDEPLNLSHILGYLGKMSPTEWSNLKKENYQFTDLMGKTGLEKEYEKTLRGQPGRVEYEVDAQGKIVKTINQLKAVPGNDIILTLDYELEKKLTEILKIQTERLNKPKAAALALDPGNGEILALVSLPLFDNNIFSEPQKFKEQVESFLVAKNQPLFNRAISGEYPSGSTIKPVFATAALEEGIINEGTTVLSTGGLQINQWFFPDWNTAGHGLTNVTRALAESINTFFYYLSGGFGDFKGLGLEKMIAYAKAFGLGHALGIDLPGEANGFLPSREWKKQNKSEDWYIGDTYHLAIGQGDILVTPLQIAVLTATIANGGIVYQPHLVKEIKGINQKETKVTAPKIINHDFISKENIEIVRRGLKQAVTSGSAQALADLPFATAGKTGTAQVGRDELPHAWFTVFAPYENPALVLTILIENGGEGSAAALPVATEVLRWYFENH